MQEDRIIIILVGTVTLLYILINHVRIKRLPRWKLIVSAFLALLVSWIFSLLEDAFWPETLQRMEHVTALAGGILIFLWIWKVFAGRGRDAA